MRPSRIGIIQIVLFLVGMVIVSHALYRYEKKRAADDLMNKGNYLVTLIGLHQVKDFSGPKRDFISRTLYENMFSEGLLYAVIIDKNGYPLVALDPEKILPQVPQSIQTKVRFAMGLAKDGFTVPGSKALVYEYSKPLFEGGERAGAVRLGFRGKAPPFFSLERTWLLATVAFFIFAMVPFFYYGLTLAFKPIKDIHQNIKSIGGERESIGAGAAKVPHVDGVIRSLEEALQHLRQKYKDLESACNAMEANRGLVSYETKQFSNVLDSIYYGIIITDAQDNVAQVNAYMLNLLDKKVEEVVDHPLDEVLDHERILTFISQKEAIEKIGGSNYIETTFPDLAPGEVFQVSLSYLRDEEGHMTGTVISTKNITQEKSAESAKHEFVAHVSHELRAPLTTIKSYNEMLMGGEIQDDETKKEFYNTISEETDRLARLIENLLNISKIEMGNLSIQTGILKTDLFLEDCIAAIEAPAQRKHIQIEKNMPDKFPSIVADKELLKVAVINILGNAIKYTPENGKLTFAMSEQDNMIVFDIMDTGVGISKEDIPHIFEKFYRSSDHNVTEQTGSGLGLALSAEIIQLHDGKIEVQSKPGEGTHFTVRIPKEQYYLGTK